MSPQSTPVHPRWRGEHTPGSPSSDSGQRFIPAGAGNTETRIACDPLRSVHPRWRGEHEAKVDVFRFKGGSSPLARGTRLAAVL